MADLVHPTEARGEGAQAPLPPPSFETRLQPRPVCPHCGYVHDDAWEWRFGPGHDGTAEERTCYRCEGLFDCDRVVDVSYTTRKVK